MIEYYTFISVPSSLYLYLHLEFQVCLKKSTSKLTLFLWGNFEDNYNNNTIILDKDS